ncbi:hypothetical protein [Methylorubrum sp. GM97]|uniref:hypothetical protein n=1 Tax=Methylorubrum sp. GM97 TaxID=2938232 RepID=UPI00218BF5BB|nr:hypothetical protein [Methylorubrum sp. GM97]BDL39021.1 hypothetical protein MSPGM_16110 [Methylorubrum sp. GM97]
MILVIDQPHPKVVRAVELKALRARALDAWYGGARPVSPHGRRSYRYRRVVYLTENHAPNSPLPAPAAGQAALRAILQGWRTGEYALLGSDDDERGGAVRQALVAAGMLLAGDPDDDARERTNCLVTVALGPRAKYLDRSRERLLTRPAP